MSTSLAPTLASGPWSLSHPALDVALALAIAALGVVIAAT